MITYDALFPNLRRDIAVPLELSHGHRPGGRVRGSGCDIPWDPGAREPPNGDSFGRNLSSIDTTFDGVESITVRRSVVRANSASCILVLTRRIDVAVGGTDLARKVAIVRDGASFVGMKGNRIGVLVMDTFDDIDLAIVGPVRAKRPATAGSAGVLYEPPI